MTTSCFGARWLNFECFNLTQLDSNKYRQSYMLYAMQDAFATMQNRLIVIRTEEISLTVYPLFE
jgi:hypothetical protein